MLNKWKRKLWIAGAALVGVMLLFSLISIQINLDLGKIIIGLAFLLITYTVYAMFEYTSRPKKQIHIMNKVSLTAPSRMMKPFVTYKLHISAKYEIEEKGESKEITLDEIDFSFNKSDHPKVYEYCLGIINSQIQKNIELVRQKHPEALVLETETALPEEVLLLKEKSED
ncbi:MAG: hypothetical protein ACI8XB_000520 [Patiriisocius sp.]|jgi:hypothetical protein